MIEEHPIHRAAKKGFDLGAGTGKFTKLLAASTHSKVLAIEPVA